MENIENQPGINPQEPIERSQETDLDSMKELDKGPDNIYYIIVPKPKYPSQYQDKLIKRSTLRHKSEYRQDEEYQKLNKEIRQIENQVDSDFTEKLSDLINKAYGKKFGPGVKYKVISPSFKGVGSANIRTISQIIPIGLRACKALAVGEPVHRNQIIDPYDSQKIRQIAGIGSDNINANSYFVELGLTMREKELLQKSELPLKNQRASSAKKRELFRTFYKKK